VAAVVEKMVTTFMFFKLKQKELIRKDGTQQIQYYTNIKYITAGAYFGNDGDGCAFINNKLNLDTA
jgi:hypothetical protein